MLKARCSKVNFSGSVVCNYGLTLNIESIHAPEQHSAAQGAQWFGFTTIGKFLLIMGLKTNYFYQLPIRQ